MTPFCYLDIPNHQQISNKLLDLVTNSLYSNYNPKTKNTYFSFTPTPGQPKFDIRNNNEFWNMLDYQDLLTHVPELKEALDKLGVTIVNMNLIMVKTGEAVLHSDLSGNPALTERINWPIVNALTSETRFYKMKPAPATKVGRAVSGEPNKGFIMYSPAEIESWLGTYTLSQPLIFNFKIPHSVHPIPGSITTHPGMPRLLLTITVHTTGFLKD